ncbi:MAG TPA: hypothetical protein DEG65_04760 [Methylophaga sp.]|nr:hypothetical protein [Methylophaga sp.]|tara:strand:+ start:173 stop:499 length:327 start_codon:yes stop_codon:yes gene_type:complete
MKYVIKNFVNEAQEDGSTLKLVGFMVEDDNGNKLAIDKRVPATGTDEEQIAVAQAASQQEIDEWQTQFAVIGKVWDADSHSFAPEPEPTPEPEPIKEPIKEPVVEEGE